MSRAGKAEQMDDDLLNSFLAFAHLVQKVPKQHSLKRITLFSLKGTLGPQP